MYVLSIKWNVRIAMWCFGAAPSVPSTVARWRCSASRRRASRWCACRRRASSRHDPVPSPAYLGTPAPVSRRPHTPLPCPPPPCPAAPGAGCSRPAAAGRCGNARRPAASWRRRRRRRRRPGSCRRTAAGWPPPWPSRDSRRRPAPGTVG